jgi:hypothetical protein
MICPLQHLSMISLEVRTQKMLLDVQLLYPKTHASHLLYKLDPNI